MRSTVGSAKSEQILRDRLLITGEGGRGLVERGVGGGSDIFVHEKRGGGKIFCAI
jgi:hypothetical protein